jgi:excisionase family DNA binding protein
LLGVSRQHVVDLCDRGDLPCTRTGSHRRVRRADVQRYLDPELTREQEKSLWLHRALLGPLMRDPQGVLEAARQNLRRWSGVHRSDGMSASYLGQWSQVLDDGVDDVVRVLTSMDDRSSELRQNSPFAGVLPDAERRQVLQAFGRHWVHEHVAA